MLAALGSLGIAANTVQSCKCQFSFPPTPPTPTTQLAGGIQLAGATLYRNRGVEDVYCYLLLRLRPSILPRTLTSTLISAMALPLDELHHAGEVVIVTANVIGYVELLLLICLRLQSPTASDHARYFRTRMVTRRFRRIWRP